MEDKIIIEPKDWHLLTPKFLELSISERMLFDKIFEMSAIFLINSIKIKKLPVKIRLCFLDYCLKNNIYKNGHQLISPKVVERLKAVYHDAEWARVEPDMETKTHFVLELSSHRYHKINNIINIQFRNGQGKIFPNNNYNHHKTTIEDSSVFLG